MNNTQIMKEFVNGATKGKANNVFIDGDAIYSYGWHFPLAFRQDDTFYFNVDKYSSSTSKHQCYLKRALVGTDCNARTTQELKNLINKSILSKYE